MRRHSEHTPNPSGPSAQINAAEGLSSAVRLLIPKATLIAVLLVSKLVRSFTSETFNFETGFATVNTAFFWHMPGQLTLSQIWSFMTRPNAVVCDPGNPNLEGIRQEARWPPRPHDRDCGAKNPSLANDHCAWRERPSPVPLTDHA